MKLKCKKLCILGGRGFIVSARCHIFISLKTCNKSLKCITYSQDRSSVAPHLHSCGEDSGGGAFVLPLHANSVVLVTASEAYSNLTFISTSSSDFISELICKPNWFRIWLICLTSSHEHSMPLRRNRIQYLESFFFLIYQRGTRCYPLAVKM